MAFTQEDLQSAAAKLATLDFTPAELEAIATTIRRQGGPEPAEVSGFGFEPSNEPAGFVFEPNDEPVWAMSFIPAVAGLMRQPNNGETI